MTASQDVSQLVFVAGAPPGEERQALAAATRHFLQRPPLVSARSILVAAASSEMARDLHGPVRAVAALLITPDRSIRIVAPPRRLAGSLLRAANPAQWSTVSLPEGWTRFDRIEIPRTFTDAEALVFVNRLAIGRRGGSPVIGIWSRFVRPLPRLGAVVTDPRDGLTADLALGFRPALVVLVGRAQGISIVVATADQIAAELLGLAVSAIDQVDLDPETAIGPWEDALVQRATELGVGISLPEEIILRTEWVGGNGDARAAFAAIVTEVSAAIGSSGPSNAG